MTGKISPSSNLYLFYGEDDFSLRRKIDRWKEEFAKKYSASAISFLDAQNLDESDLIRGLQNILAPSLFASKKLIIIRDGLPRKADQVKLAEYLLDLQTRVSKDDFVVFWQTSKPDGRLKFTKEFKGLVIINEFELPHGRMLDQWIKAMAKTLGTQISDEAVERLAQFLGRDLYQEKKAGGRVIERKEAFNLWEAYSELQKLTSNDQIGLPQINQLVKPKLPDSVFLLTDQVIARNQKGAFTALENFLASATTDEKNAFPKIIGLLSEQIRSLLLVSLLQQENLSEEKIADRLGWSSGRVFVTSKNLKNISVNKLKQLLSELLIIDHKIKSTDSNTKLEIDLFLTMATSKI